MNEEVEKAKQRLRDLALKLGLEKKGLDLGHIENIKKLDVEDKKVSAMKKKNPEHISDK